MKNHSKIKLVFLIFTIFCTKSIVAQVKSFDFELADIPFFNNSKKIDNPFAGGINSGQFYRIDLNGIEPADLLVFDRTNHRIITFLAEKNAQNEWYWKHAPQYESRFPMLEAWVVVADFNADQKADLLTFGQLGAKLFLRNSNYNDLQNSNEWTLAEDPIFYEKNGAKVNLQIGYSDKPDALDVDKDGDVDILAFDPEGDYVQWYKNMTIERKLDKNKPEFVREGFCWGNFYKEHCKDLKFDVDCQTGKLLNATSKNSRVSHAGNSLLVADIDNDGKNDAIFGHVTCSNIGFLKNEGTNLIADFNQAIYQFPSSQTIDFQLFPSVYYDDFNFDGIKDLIASPTVISNNPDYSIDFKASTWFAAGQGFGKFGAIQINFLQSQMLDLGESSKPVFFDVDLDGDLDILVGYGAQRTSQGARADAALFTNAGTLAKPSFTITNNNFLSTLVNDPAELWQQVLFYTLDFDADKKPDLVVRLDTFKGTFFYVLTANRKSNDWLKTPWFSLNHKPADQSAFFDIDGNGVLDFIKMSAAGVFTPYLNKGTLAKPIFEEQAQDLALGKTFKTFSLNSLDLDQNGTLELYNGADEIDWKNKVLKSAKIKGFLPENLGAFLNVNTADIDADSKTDVIIGNNAGGIAIYVNKTEGLILAQENPKNSSTISIYPNPFQDKLTIYVLQKGELNLFNSKGALILQEKLQAGKNEISRAKSLANGIYIAIFQDELGKKSFGKLIKK